MNPYSVAEQFLQVVFSGRTDHLVYAHAHHSIGRSWKQFRKFESLNPAWDNYVSQAGFPADASTNRTQARALGVWALVVDDIGTKADRGMVEMALGPPSYEVLTSPGNSHWWYRLSKPVPVRQWREFFRAALPGVPVDENTLDGTHVFRLPCGVNTKETAAGFAPCRGQINPDIEIDVDGILPFVAPASEPRPFRRTLNVEQVPDIRGIVALVPNRVKNRLAWVARACEIKIRSEDEVNGLEAFKEFSARWEVEQPDGTRGLGNYDEAETEELWHSIHEVRGTKGFNLLAEAEAAAPAEYARIMGVKKKAKKAFNDNPECPDPFDGVDFFVDQERSSIEVVKHFAGKLRCVGRGDWREFDEVTGRWREWTGEHMFRRVLELVNTRKARALDPDVSKKLASVKFIEGIARAAGLHVSVMAKATDFDRVPLLLGVPSGVIDLHPGASRVVRPGRASEMVSKAMWVDPAPAGTPHPEWSRFLDEFTRKDKSLEGWLQVRAGYCLTGLMDEYIMPFYHGPGGNGKSVYLNALRSVWGEYGTQMDHRLLFEKQGGYHLAPLAVLAGVRLAIVTDVPQDAVWDVLIMKMLTGDDAITANRMHQNPITFKSTAKVDVSGNGEPVVKDMDEGIRRRLLAIPLTATPEVIDKQLSRKLASEYPAILRWALTGLDKYWQLGGFPAARSVEEATKEYHALLDPFQRWLDTLEQDRAPDAKLTRTELFKSWDAFRCSEGKYGMSPVNMSALIKKMKEKDFVFGMVDGYSILRGYKFAPNRVSNVF